MTRIWLPLLALMMACACSRKPETIVESEPDLAETFDLTSEAWTWADSINSSMTLEEQLAQMVMPAIFASADDVTMERLKWYAEDLRVGGILLLKGTAEEAAQIADSLETFRDRNPYSPGTFLAVDAETGLGMRFSDAPLFPWLSDIHREADDQTFFDYGQEVGREARIAGINMVLGPVVDVDRDERKGGSIMKKRSLGSDQLRVSELSLAYARGLESQGVLSVAKHFPGHGPTSTDTHKGLATITTPRDELYAIDLMPFRTVVQNGLSCVMVGHIWVQALDSIRRPASFSPVVIQGLLREEMGFQGLVLVDAVGMGAAKGYTGADAIMAGADIIIAPADTERELSILQQAVIDGLLTEQQIDETCRRILFHKYLRGLHDSHRSVADTTENIKIKEHLHKEAPHIIGRLNGK